ncbi:MAG TPA: pyridoxamine 5'-phosphate oxidase, partial [Alphaproteobacteria bacterium]|nr:pyridoxamine 5'-phosphate oxidase [Alphaproteobacteria bacterium]
LLLKKFDERGFCFFTNYNGRKSEDLKENPFAAICIYWPALEKQIRIEGKVERVSKSESDEYFLSRPRESRIGAWTSKQSQALESRERFLAELEQVRKDFNEKEVTRPENWGGWRLIPDVIEFWKAEEFRFHNREVYTKNENGTWNKKLLYP